jgi:phosphoglycolate phosphatase
MNGYSLVAFDLDGTLLDTLDDLTSAVNAALKEYAFPLRTKAQVCAFIGNGIKNLIERAIGEKDHPLFERVFSYFKGYYKEHCAKKTAPYAGVMELLKALKENGVKTAVLSNKADFATKMLVKKYFGDLIDQAAGENESAGIRKKPAPDALFSIMQTLGETKENTVYVGDSDVDIQTAKNAGVDCISCTWGFRDRKFLEENGGKIFVNTPLEILNFCLKK